MGMRQDIRQRLSDLASGDLDPADASEWALSVMEGEDEELKDPSVWTALDRMGGADVMVGPGEYMHDKEDFTAWHKDFIQSLMME